MLGYATRMGCLRTMIAARASGARWDNPELDHNGAAIADGAFLGLPTTKWACEDFGNRECFHTMWAAAEGGHIDLIIWFAEHNYPMDARMYEHAIDGGHVHIIEWLASRIDPVADTMRAAAQVGRVDIMEWLRSADTCSGPCPWDYTACHAAAQHGHLDALNWLRSPENGVCPWRKMYCVDRYGNEIPARVAKWIKDNRGEIEPSEPGYITLRDDYWDAE